MCGTGSGPWEIQEAACTAEFTPCYHKAQSGHFIQSVGIVGHPAVDQLPVFGMEKYTAEIDCGILTLCLVEDRHEAKNHTSRCTLANCDGSNEGSLQGIWRGEWLGAYVCGGVQKGVTLEIRIWSLTNLASKGTGKRISERGKKHEL